MTARADAGPDHVVRAEGLEVRYHGGPEPAVKGVSLALLAGEGLLVEGEPGSGKTSLLRGLLGLVPARGDRRLFGVLPGDGRTPGRVGFGPQGLAFAAGLRPLEAVTLLARLRGAAAGRSAAAQELERVGLSPSERRTGERLDLESGRRLSLAVAGVGEPGLLVLDDPWESPETADAVARARGRGAAVILASAEPGRLAELVDRRLRLVDGAPA